MVIIKRNEKPKLDQIQLVLPFSAEYPYGMDKPIRTACQKQLGAPYTGYNIRRQGYYLNENARWYCKNMTLYVRDEKDLGIITMELLKKTINK
jgi:hypothetical protein